MSRSDNDLVPLYTDEELDMLCKLYGRAADLALDEINDNRAIDGPTSRAIVEYNAFDAMETYSELELAFWKVLRTP
jgi:hypothetical protein